MKNIFALYPFSLSLALLAAAGWSWNTSQVQQDLRRLHRAEARRLAEALGPWLERAHQTQEDTALQQAVMALAQAQGVSFAAVLDPQDKTLAHSRIALIGRPLPARALRSAFAFPLKNGKETWGTLVFPLTSQGLDAFQRSLHLRGLAGGVMLLVLSLGMERRWRRQCQSARAEADGWKILAQDEEKARHILEQAKESASTL